MKSTALVIHACDRYALLFKGFSYFFEKYWNHDIATKNYFLTESLAVSIPNFQNIQSGKGEWSDRLRIALEQIPKKFILYIQEDVWFNHSVSKDFYEKLFAFAEEKEAKLIKLHSSLVYKTKPTDTIIDGLQVTILDNEASEFLMSHQISLWNREFLIAQLPKGEHPWRNERKGTQRLRKQNPVIYHLDAFACDGCEPINDNLDNSKRSGYDSISGNAMLWVTADTYIDVLKADPDPETKAYGEKLRYHYDNKITHDGKSVPNKRDFFKRIKEWLKK